MGSQSQETVGKAAAEYKLDYLFLRRAPRWSIYRTGATPARMSISDVQSFSFHDAAKLGLRMTELIVETTQRPLPVEREWLSCTKQSAMPSSANLC